MSQIEYMNNKKGEPVREIHFDAEDGAVEAIRLYDELADQWFSLDLADVDPSLISEVETFINEFIQSESGITNEILEAM